MGLTSHEMTRRTALTAAGIGIAATVSTRNEYLAAENHILKSQIKGRLLVAQKFDGSQKRGLAGRPRVDVAIEELVVKLARENSGWGYDRIVGAVANLGHNISDQSVGNILRRHGIAPAPKRKQGTTWSDFIRSHLDVLAGTDFFTVEVLTWRGLATIFRKSSS